MSISCTFANVEETHVNFTDNRGKTYTVPIDWPGRFREQDNDGGGVVGFLANGGVIGPYVCNEPAFADLNRIQFEFMVEKLGLAPAIDAAIAAMPGGTDVEENAKIMAKVLFRSGQRFERSHPLFDALAPAVGLTPEQIDTAWRTAASL